MTPETKCKECGSNEFTLDKTIDETLHLINGKWEFNTAKCRYLHIFCSDCEGTLIPGTPLYDYLCDLEQP